MSNVKKLMMTAAGGGEPAYVEDVFSTYVRTGNSSITDVDNGVNLGNNVTSPISSPQNSTGLVYFNGYYYYANGSGYVYRTDDVATTATAVQTGSGINRLAAGSTYIYSATSGGFYYSTNGTSWTQTSSKPIGSYNHTADCMAEFGGTWYVVLQHPINGTNGILSYSSNQGSSWTDNTSAPFYGSSLKFLTVVNSRMYAGTTGGALYYTTNGTSWTTCSGAVAANQVAYVGSNYVAAGNNGQIYYSSNGQSFTGTGTLTGLTGTTAVQTVASDGTTAYAVGYGTGSGSYYYTSTNGSSWTQTSSTTRSSGDGTSGFCVLTSDYFAHKFGSLDLDGTSEGGVLWMKRRSDTGNHWFHDTVRGTLGFPVRGGTSDKSYNNTDHVTSFNTNGFTTGTSENSTVDTYAWWSFRKYPKFFDVVTYTGNNTNGRTISHNLGSVPGMILIKCTSLDSTSWVVWHRSLTNANYYMSFNTSDQESNGGGTFPFNGTAPTDSVFSVADGNSNRVNASGQTYIAYLFAHNNNDGGFGLNGDQDIIKCGSVTLSSGYTDVDLGFEPQFIIIKKTNGSQDWHMMDTMRGLPDVGYKLLYANRTDREYSSTTTNPVRLTPTGMEVNTNYFGSGDFAYIAIRRGPMKTPENATDVFDVQRGASPFTSDFPVDLGIQKNVTSTGNWFWYNRLRGDNRYTMSNSTNADATSASQQFDKMDEWGGSNWGSQSAGYSFRRAPGFFDMTIIPGNGSTTNTTHYHNLGVVPELIIGKQVSTGNSWWVYHKDVYPNDHTLNTDGYSSAAYVWNDSSSYVPTETTFTTRGQGFNEATSNRYVIYLWATLAGISKVGTYTGNGSSSGDAQNIDCGFSSGARFVMVKRINHIYSDWYVADTGRGINAGNDSYMYMNRDNAEYTSVDWIDPYSSGFTAVYTNDYGINVSGDTYMYLAIA